MAAFNVEVARRVQKSDGTQPVVDAVIRGATFFALNAGSTVILAGRPVAFVPDGGAEEQKGRIPLWNSTATAALPPFIFPIVLGGGAVTKLCGVSIDNINPGEIGEIAGPGCILSVASDANFGVHGDAVVAGSGPGFVTTQSTRPGPGQQLGTVAFRAGNGLGNTGDALMLGVYVNPC